jgi:hypothetical protein
MQDNAEAAGPDPDDVESALRAVRADRSDERSADRP